MSFVAGWYADPARPGALRWWDGVGWTASVAPSPSPAPPAYAPPAYPPPAYTPPPVAQPAYGAVTKEPWSPIELVVPAERTMATRALVWGILSVPLFIAFPVWIMAITFGIIGIARANRLRAMGGVPMGRGRSIAGLVLGCVGVLLNVALYGAFFAYSRFSG